MAPRYLATLPDGSKRSVSQLELDMLSKQASTERAKEVARVKAELEAEFAKERQEVESEVQQRAK